ncbi:hypothetical protein GCM10023349_16860 [Nocardioides conyzicola]|uniref:Septum formation-related domain-containing protein n=1 Tax=Nocardioides conyzicola TaxID=1651781 RepID=A0ABP8X4I5_9ACTN
MLLLVVALAATGCTSDGAGTDAVGSTDPSSPARPAAQHAEPPAPFRAATTEAPPGYVLAQCSDLRRQDKNSGLAVRFLVPPGYHATDRDGASCGFGAGFGTEFYVGFDPRTTLKSDKETTVDPFEDEGGDDSVSDISYVADTPVYGRHRGERLDYYCYCDGQDLDERSVQARGVRLSWTTPHGQQRRHEAAYDVVTASMALVRSDRSTCRSRGRTTLFRPPIPQTESIDNYSAACHLYLRPGRNALQRYAELELRPRTTLAERAAVLRQRKHVAGVRYEPGAATLGGQPADRLVWVMVREKPGQYGEPAGRWRAVTVGTADAWATWTAPPSRWRTESKDAQRFFDSIRP